ncbi:hypothetical protein I7I50_04074 [Histoplasma capsulatum G186AR]|uniref:Uncharacterized protein n=1 Tax=Ajellomyces capsulatus TaxID=5037 RepID=A0A8H7YM38_AJECA|nr:hypothetical protein I7I52_04982 [Histoplasma capsulatum]QSS75058.1 hypothetical protein I7I50_04074 [Histoplasma capsulatum G186AR]
MSRIVWDAKHQGLKSEHLTKFQWHDRSRGRFSDGFSNFGMELQIGRCPRKQIECRPYCHRLFSSAWRRHSRPATMWHICNHQIATSQARSASCLNL